MVILQTILAHLDTDITLIQTDLRLLRIGVRGIVFDVLADFDEDRLGPEVDPS